MRLALWVLLVLGMINKVGETPVFTFNATSNKTLKTPETPNEIFWNSTKPLQWSDFQGKPRAWSVFVAQTVSVIEQTYSCDGDHFSYSIKAKFNRKKSWTKTNQNAEVLLHEQKHFDLTEIYARKMRKTYSRLENPCQYTMEDLGKIYDEYFLELRHMQTLYDIETDHGLDKADQKIWNKKIEVQLEELSFYQ